ncbi:hypothetical protein [Azospirillum griseum]|uniref:hypothetical protein n=1 Tax=Azospirillum griseum TaxID=2496639 RepID=UPI001576CE8E|nr:hypothetical protein [Azospirillum griseum]
MKQEKSSTGQHQKFMDAARELGCDEDEAAFEDKLRRIAKVKPKPEADTKAEDDEAPE